MAWWLALAFAGISALFYPSYTAIPMALAGFLVGKILEEMKVMRGQVNQLMNDDIHRLKREVASLKNELATLKKGDLPTGDAPIPSGDKSNVPAGDISIPAGDVGLSAPPQMPFAQIDRNAIGREAPPKATIQPPSPPEAPPFYKRILGGNILAQIGAIMLFLGIASGLKMAWERHTMPLSLKLAGATAIAVALLILGNRKARTEHHRLFGLAMLGGGYAILYLICFFMYAVFHVITDQVAVVGFTAIGMACLVSADFHKAQPLAVLGIIGGFLAPALANGVQADQSFLLLYFGGLVAISGYLAIRNTWPIFLFSTLVVSALYGFFWGHGTKGSPAPLWQAQLLLLGGFFVYSLSSIAMARKVDIGNGRAVSIASLLLGSITLVTASAAAIFQYDIVGGDDSLAAAWSLAGAVYYFFLQWLLRRQDPNFELPGERRFFYYLLARLHLGVAVVFFTLAIPLAFGVATTTSIWALEGAALVWWGTRMGQSSSQAAGFLMMLVSQGYFLLGMHALQIAPFLANETFVSEIIFAISTLFVAWVFRDTKHVKVLVFLAVGLIWWGIAWVSQLLLHIFLTPLLKPIGAVMLVGAFTAFLVSFLGNRLHWRDLRGSAGWLVYLMAGLGILVRLTGDADKLLLGRFSLMAAESALLTSLAMLVANDRRPVWTHSSKWTHLAMTVSFMLIFVWDLSLSMHTPIYSILVWLFISSIALLLVVEGRQHIHFWPFNVEAAEHHRIQAPLLLALTTAVFFYANLTQDGQGPGWYIPLVGLMDIGSMLAILGLYRYSITIQGNLKDQTTARWVVGVAVVVWLSAMAARIAAQYFDVPFQLYSLAHSQAFHQMLNLIWTCAAVLIMLMGSRRLSRTTWWMGFAVLGLVCAKILLHDLAGIGTMVYTLSMIVMAMVVIGVSYVAPFPPGAEDAALKDS